MQRGGGRGPACLLFDGLEAAAFEQLRRAGVRLEAVEGARRGRRPGWGRPGSAGLDRLLQTRGDLGSVVLAQLPAGPLPAQPVEEYPSQVWGDGGMMDAHPLGGTKGVVGVWRAGS